LLCDLRRFCQFTLPKRSKRRQNSTHSPQTPTVFYSPRFNRKSFFLPSVTAISRNPFKIASVAPR
jgi:hypothetical protein